MELANRKILYAIYDRVALDLGPVASAATLAAVRRDCSQILKHPQIADNVDDYELCIIAELGPAGCVSDLRVFKLKEFVESGELVASSGEVVSSDA